MTFIDIEGTERPYFHHPYNVTYDNERAIEIPLAKSFIGRHHMGRLTPCLEVGNVMSHYLADPLDRDWMVLDKYEEGEGVINADVMDWWPDLEPHWIVSISTVEHIGWDETPREPHVAYYAIVRMLAWLRPGGSLFITVPMGHNEALDPVLIRNGLAADRVSFYERGHGNVWTLGEPKPAPYNREIPSASALWVGEWTR